MGAIRIGNAPCSWGVEFADDPRNPSWEAVLDECTQAGFEGIDLGPIGFFPEDQVKFKEELDKRNLVLTSAVMFRPFHDPDAWDDCIDGTKRACRTLQHQGATQLTFIDAIAKERTTTLGNPEAAPKMDAQAWKGFQGRIEEAAKVVTEEFGLTASIHSHAGGYCDFEDELDRLLAEIDERTLKICIDTAHMTMAGMDSFAKTKEYASRVAYVHLKDIDPVKKRKTREEGIEFYTACAEDLFCQMGNGEIDFPSFRTLLDKINYSGWCTVEQDCAPDAAISKVEIAQANRVYLASSGF